MINFKLYFLSSLVAMLSVVAYACYTREQFYTIILFLVTSKISFLMAGNMIVAFSVLIGKITKSIFLGRLRDAEVELLIDRCKYSITETLLALTIFRNELSPRIILLFGFLSFVKIFHWLGKSRLDYLQQLMPIPMISHIRLFSLLVTLGMVDVVVSYLCIIHTVTAGRTVIILFGFEFGVLTIAILNYMMRYILHIIDSRYENGLTSKGLYLMLLDLLCDAMKFAVYVIFFCLVFVYYGLPIHIIRYKFYWIFNIFLFNIKV
jgi:E3 ubiquitin-protein ligase synoviolin